MLYRLERQGWIDGRWVEKAGQRRRRMYALTVEGRKVLAAQRTGWRRSSGPSIGSRALNADPRAMPMDLWRDELRTRLEPLRLRPEREAEIVDEFAQHLDDRVSELVGGGADRGCARAAALAELDAPGELARRLAAIEARSPLSASAAWRARRAAMAERRCGRTCAIAYARCAARPAFALTVVAVLALTIGPTTAILSIGNWLFWRSPPGVVEPNRLAVVLFGEWRGAQQHEPALAVGAEHRGSR